MCFGDRHFLLALRALKRQTMSQHKSAVPFGRGSILTQFIRASFTLTLQLPKRHSLTTNINGRCRISRRGCCRCSTLVKPCEKTCVKVFVFQFLSPPCNLLLLVPRKNRSLDMNLSRHSAFEQSQTNQILLWPQLVVDLSQPATFSTGQVNNHGSWTCDIYCCSFRTLKSHGVFL